MITKNIPKYVWADYDPEAVMKWAFYSSKADQRSNRPDLKPIKFKLIRVNEKKS